MKLGLQTRRLSPFPCSNLFGAMEGRMHWMVAAYLRKWHKRKPSWYRNTKLGTHATRGGKGVVGRLIR